MEMLSVVAMTCKSDSIASTELLCCATAFLLLSLHFYGTQMGSASVVKPLLQQTCWHSVWAELLQHLLRFAVAPDKMQLYCV